MDDRFQGLLKSLRRMAADTTLDLHDRLQGAEKAIKNYLEPLRGAARQSTLKRLRDVARTEAAMQRPGESDFWKSVEDIASQLSKP
jgi:hypothetical protein